MRFGALALAGILLAPLPALAGAPSPGGDCSTEVANVYACHANGCYKCVSNVWTVQPLYIGEQSASCSSTYEGQVRYNNTDNVVELCDGSNWRQFATQSAPSDSTPDAFSFTDVTDQTLNALIASNTLTITGFDGTQVASVSGSGGPEISINGGAWVTSGAIQSGQTLQVRLTSSGSVSTARTATVTVGLGSDNWSVTTRAGSLKIFRTASTYVGSGIGGLTAADGLCQTNANSAGYTGSYKALLSDDSTNAKDRVTLTYPIVRASDGTTVVDSANLWDGSTEGSIYSSGSSFDTWTGSTSTGTLSSGKTCAGWTGGTNGENGSSASSGAVFWIDHGSASCSGAKAIYCIQQ